MKERPKEFIWFMGDRILLRRLVNRQQRLMACYTDQTFITNKNLYSVLPKGIEINFLLGIINSRLMSYLYINQLTQAVKDDFPQVTIRDLLNLPIPIDIDNDTKQIIIGLSSRMVELKKRTPATPHEQESLARQIAATDGEIDQLVYELYGLTDEEIKIVES